MTDGATFTTLMNMQLCQLKGYVDISEEVT